jgi:Lipid A 3-O-deacylase (PagL)
MNKYGFGRALALILPILVCPPTAALAQSSIETNAPAAGSFSPDISSKGRFEATLTSGVLFSPFVATQGRRAVDYKVSEVQIGYMLSDARGDRWWRGNLEVVGEAFGDVVFKGEGSYIAGITAWLRYNFVPERWRLVPFAQAGMGLTATDLDHRLLGQTFNFNLNLGVGVRFFVAHNLSVNAEYRYQHISNANMSDRNLGVNADGPILGVSLFF